MINTNVYIGIDPGANGAITSISKKGIRSVPLHGLHPTSWLTCLKDMCNGFAPYIAMEKVTGYIPKKRFNKEGKEYTGETQPGHLMFNFGHNRGTLYGMCIALSIYPADCGYAERLFEPSPQTWLAFYKKYKVPLSPRKRNETDGQWKSRLKRYAYELYPYVKIVGATADSLLLAHYCFKMIEGT